VQADPPVKAFPRPDLEDRFSSISIGPLNHLRIVLTTGVTLGASQVIAGIATIIAARALGPEGKGIVSAVTVWPAMLAGCFIAGLHTSASVRVAASKRDSTPEVLGNALAYALVVGGLVTAVAVAVVPQLLSHLGEESRALAVWSLVTVPLGILFEVLVAINLACGKFRRYNVARTVGPLMTLLLTVVLTLANSVTPGRMVFVTVLSWYLPLFVVARNLPWRQARVNLEHLKQDLSFGLKTHAGTLLSLVNLRLDVLLMSLLVSAVQVGLYSAANSIMIPIAAIGMAASLHATPTLARMAGDGAEIAAQAAWVRRSAVFYLCLSAGLGIILVLAAPLIPMLLGSEFAPSVLLSQILVPGFVARTYSSVVAGGAVGMRRPWIGNIPEIVAVALTLVLLPPLLAADGARGAAVASTIAYLAAAAVSAITVRRLSRHGKTSPVADPDIPLVSGQPLA
jgi:O-antigen/teichoic acid export membrane protein